MSEEIKRRYTRTEIKLSHIEKWRESGLSMTSYSDKAGISSSNLSKWVRATSKPKEKFKPLSLSPSVPIIQNNVIEIVVDNRIKIRLPNMTDTSMLIHIIRSLMQCN